MKLLNGSELAGYIKERQSKQVRRFIQADKIKPRLAIVLCNQNPVCQTYVRLKRSYGEDILVDVDVIEVKQTDALKAIKKLNDDKTVHGIIVQLPLPDESQTDEILNAVKPEKDVDGLSSNSLFDPATPIAILWLLNGHNIELAGKKITLVGRGRLVGAPLRKMMEKSGLEVRVINSQTKNPAEILLDSNIIITAAGRPEFISSTQIPKNCVVVDAGVASDKGQLKGDLAEDVYERDDLTLTPRKGGVGPLTVAALFDNLIRAASKNIPHHNS